jgi:hypothetical protein
MYADEDKTDWRLQGVDAFGICLEGKWWLVATTTDNDKTFVDDGPYDTAELAAISATLQEQR